MLELVNVSKVYTDVDGTSVEALQDASCRLPSHGFIAVIGRSGSGKSTFLNVLGGMDEPTAGQVLCNKRDLRDYSDGEMDAFRARTVSYMFQEYNLIQRMTAIENVMLALRFQGVNERECRELSRRALDTVGLSAYEQREARRMSGGQQQRVAIARALAKNSNVILCDEPTGNLDQDTAREIMEVLKKISIDRLVVLVTHDHALAEEFCDGTIVIDHGRIQTLEGIVRSENREPVADLKENNKDNTSKKAFSLSARNILRYSLYYLRRGLLPAFAVFVLCTVMFAVLMVLRSAENYSRGKVLYYSLRDNGIRAFPVTRYVDKVIDMGGGSLMYGPSAEYQTVSAADEEVLKKQVGQDVPIYRAYYFFKSLDDFSTTSEYGKEKLQEKWFREFVAINDFETSKIPLFAGAYPREKEDVLISDYMAWNMVKQGKFEGIDEISELIGYELCDRYTGFRMRVAGIYKSDWERLSEYYESFKLGQFVSAYLAKLQTVYGQTEFVPTIVSEGAWCSVESMVFSAYGTETEINLGDAPMKMVYDVSDIPFLGEFNSTDAFIGVLLTKGQLADYLGVDVGLVNEKFVNEHQDEIARMSFTPTAMVTHGEMEYTGTLGMVIGVIGIVDSDVADQWIRCYESNSDGVYWFVPTGQFRQFYCGFTGDESFDRRWVSSLVPVYQTDEFYLSHRDYSWEAFAAYTPEVYFVYETVGYLGGIAAVGRKLAIAAILLTIMAILVYGILSIRKHQYEIGLYRSLGANRKTIAAVFGAEMFIVVVVSALAATGVARILMRMINSSFAKDYIVPVTIIDLSGKDVLFPGLLGIGIALFAIAASVFRLFFTTPSALLRLGRN